MANAYYTDTRGPLLAMQIDEAAVAGELRWEPPTDPALPGVEPETLFPHLYGSLGPGAVTASFEVTRDTDRDFIGLLPGSDRRVQASAARVGMSGDLRHAVPHRTAACR